VSDRNPPDAALLATSRIVENLAYKYTAARRHLQREMSILDGISGDNGDPKVKATTELTSVEAAAGQLEHLHKVLADLKANVRAVAVIAHNASKDCDRIIGIRVAVPRCDAAGRDGTIEWGDPTCTAVPTRGPLCDRCSKREYRWRVAHRLPLRADGVFSAMSREDSGVEQEVLDNVSRSRYTPGVLASRVPAASAGVVRSGEVSP
jgi:hypothetical protein